MRHITLVMVVTLLGCGGGGSGGTPLSAHDVDNLCADVCNWNAACGLGGGAACVSECVAGTDIRQYIRGDLVELQVECLVALPCDATEGQKNDCIPDVTPRPAHENYSSTCRSRGAACEWSSSLITRRCQDTDYWAYTDDVMNDFTACFSEGCNAIPACILAASREYDFEENW